MPSEATMPVYPAAERKNQSLPLIPEARYELPTDVDFAPEAPTLNSNRTPTLRSTLATVDQAALSQMMAEILPVLGENCARIGECVGRLMTTGYTNVDPTGTIAATDAAWLDARINALANTGRTLDSARVQGVAEYTWHVLAGNTIGEIDPVTGGAE